MKVNSQNPDMKDRILSKFLDSIRSSISGSWPFAFITGFLLKVYVPNVFIYEDHILFVAIGQFGLNFIYLVTGRCLGCPLLAIHSSWKETNCRRDFERPLVKIWSKLFYAIWLRTGCQWRCKSNDGQTSKNGRHSRTYRTRIFCRRKNF